MADMQQSLRQASIRAVTGTTHTYEGDWHALFDSLGIAAGDFNGRLLQYINTRLSASYTEINGAMAAMAAAEGVNSFQAIGTFTPSLNNLSASAGSYLVTGVDATLVRALPISASAGSYAVTGVDATLTYSSGSFSPLDLTPSLWIDPSDLTTLFQSNAGSTAVASDADPVGYAGDKSGGGFHLTSAADDTTRPLYKTGSGLHWLLGDGSNDILRRNADLGIFAAGACTIAIAVKGNPATDRVLVSCGSSSDNDPMYLPLRSLAALATTNAVLIRNDASTTISNSANLCPLAYDNNAHVIVFTDNGSELKTYLDGSLVDTDAYTRSACTFDRFALFGLLRATASSWFAAEVYGLACYPTVIDSTGIANLTTWLGAKAGLTL